MHIYFSREAGVLFDLLFTLDWLCNEDVIKEDIKQYEVTIDKTLDEALQIIKTKDIDKKILNFFFNAETRIYQTFAGFHMIWKCKTLDNYLNYIKHQSREDIIYNLLASLKEKSQLNEDVDAMLSNQNLMFNFIKKLEVSSGTKWNIFDFIENTPSYIENFIQFIKDFEPLYLELTIKFKDRIDDFYDYVEQNIESRGFEYLKNITKNFINYDEVEDICLAPSVSGYGLFHDIKDKQCFMFMGVYFDKIIYKLSGLDDIKNNLLIFKNLSDPTRFQIIKMLEYRGHYGQEISEKLGITTATVSYHLNYLMIANLVSTEKSDHRVYYSLNKEALKNAMKFLKNELRL